MPIAFTKAEVREIDSGRVICCCEGHGRAEERTKIDIESGQQIYELLCPGGLAVLGAWLTELERAIEIEQVQSTHIR